VITIGLTFVALLVLGAPVAFCIGISALAGLLDQGGTPLLLIPHMMFQGTDSFPLLAVPFFILAGALMNAGGITRRLVEFVNLLVGHIRGGLALVTVVASMIFAGITGAAVAEASAIGSVLIPAMREEGYEIEFTAAVVAASSTLGPIIPPSIPMIIYGVAAEQSIAALFLAGVIPGLLIGLGFMGVVLRKSGRPGVSFPRPSPWQGWRRLARGLKDAILALLMPGIFSAGSSPGSALPPRRRPWRSSMPSWSAASCTVNSAGAISRGSSPKAPSSPPSSCSSSPTPPFSAGSWRRSRCPRR